MNPDPTTNPTSLADEVSSRYSAGVDEVRRRAEDVQRRAGAALSQGEQYVHENPWPVILGAAAIGLLVGAALSRRHEPTFRERYVDEPAGHFRDALYAALAPVAKRLRDDYGHLRESAESMRDIDTDDLTKPVRRWGRNLGKFLHLS